MKCKPHYRGKGKRSRSVLRLPDLENAKNAVLNSLTNFDSQRGSRHAIDEFVEWYCSEPRLALNRTVVMRYRSYLELRQLAPGTIIFAWEPYDGWHTRRQIAACSAPISPLAFPA